MFVYIGGISSGLLIVTSLLSHSRNCILNIWNFRRSKNRNITSLKFKFWNLQTAAILKMAKPKQTIFYWSFHDVINIFGISKRVAILNTVINSCINYVLNVAFQMYFN